MLTPLSISTSTSGNDINPVFPSSLRVVPSRIAISGQSLLHATSNNKTRPRPTELIAIMSTVSETPQPPPHSTGKPQILPCRYKTGKTLGAGSYSVVKECVHIDTGRYYACKVINKRLMAGREHMVSLIFASRVAVAAG